ncbi:MAG: patatin-like phospholipase family protein [Candidatus Binatia bacterium]
MNLFRAPSGPVVGVALGGGGAAALAEIGVLEVFASAGIPVVCVAGTSAGSIVGAAFAAGRLDGLREAMCSLTRRRAIWLFDPVWPRLALFEGRSSMEFIRPYVGENVEDLPLPFAAVAADLDNGEEIVIQSGPVTDAIRASVAVPGLFTPHRLDGRWLVDGGLVNPLPVSVARQLGATFVIAVSVLPIGDRTHDSLFAAYRAARERWLSVPLLARLLRRDAQQALATVVEADESPAAALVAKQRRLSAVLSQASKVVQGRIAASRLREEPPDFLVSVPLPDIGLFDFHCVADAVTCGRQTAEAALPELRAVLTEGSRRSRIRSLGRWWPRRIVGPRPGVPAHRSALRASSGRG